MRVARSSNDQCETGVPASAGLVVASTRTLWRSSGGKSPRSARPREIKETLQPLLAEAVAPARDGVGVATKLGGDVVVAWHAGLSAAENEARPESEPLRRGTGIDQPMQL